MKIGADNADKISDRRKRIRLVALLAVCLLFAGLAFAQTNAEPTQAIPSAKAQRTAVGSEGGVPNAKSAIPTPEQKLGSSETTAKGTHEGIQVHGYWTIEVRDPDGKVTAHREFENAVQPTGQSYLEALLGGYTSPGGLVVALNGATIQWVSGLRYSLNNTEYTAPLPTFSEAGPCPPYQTNLSPLLSQSSGGPATGTTCLIVDPPTPTTASWLSSLCLGVPSTSCSSNLSVTGVQSYLDDTLSIDQGSVVPLALSGSIAVASGVSGGNINDVETLFTTCPSTPGVGWDSCRNYWNPSLPKYSEVIGSPVTPSNALVSVFTEKNLDGLNGDPQPVPYQPGQTIAVTVQISFQ